MKVRAFCKKWHDKISPSSCIYIMLTTEKKTCVEKHRVYSHWITVTVIRTSEASSKIILYKNVFNSWCFSSFMSNWVGSYQSSFLSIFFFRLVFWHYIVIKFQFFFFWLLCIRKIWLDQTYFIRLGYHKRLRV
jgi:hypothetical protein